MFPDDDETSTPIDYDALTDRELLLAVLRRMDSVVAIGQSVEQQLGPILKSPMLKMLGRGLG